MTVMYCGDFSSNSAYERMKSTSNDKGYTATYSRRGPTKRKNNIAGFKLATGLVTVGVISYMIWKNVVKPASEAIAKFSGLFSEDESDNVVHGDDRIFSGKCRPLTKIECRTLERKYAPINGDVKYVISDD